MRRLLPLFLLVFLLAPARAQEDPSKDAAIYRVLAERAWESYSKKDFETATKRYRLALKKLERAEVSALLARSSEHDCQCGLAACLSLSGKGAEALAALDRAVDTGIVH